LGPIPNPQSPIPNPQSPFLLIKTKNFNIINNKLFYYIYSNKIKIKKNVDRTGHNKLQINNSNDISIFIPSEKSNSSK